MVRILLVEMKADGNAVLDRVEECIGDTIDRLGQLEEGRTEILAFVLGNGVTAPSHEWKHAVDPVARIADGSDF